MPAEIFILIPGRTSHQGTAPNEGKFTPGSVGKISSLSMSPSGSRVGRRVPANPGRVE
jgi:hypothetical protein